MAVPVGNGVGRKADDGGVHIAVARHLRQTGELGGCAEMGWVGGLEGLRLLRCNGGRRGKGLRGGKGGAKCGWYSEDFFSSASSVSGK